MLNRNKKVVWILIVFLVILVANFKSLAKAVYPIKYKEYILEYSEKYSLNPNLVAAIIKTESKFDVNAKSSKGAMGAMQIMPDTGEWIAEQLGIENFTIDMLYNEKINIEMGCWYLNNLNTEFKGNFQLVVAAYNGGPGNVKKWLKDEECSRDGVNLQNIPFKETNKYVKKVKLNYKIYDFLYKL